MLFEFATANQIIFGNGTLSKVGEIAFGFGNRALVVGGSGSVPMGDLLSILEQKAIKYKIFRVGKEPDVPTILAGLELARSFQCEFVIANGGGSVIDSAKAIAALITNPGELMDYLEVIGRGQKISKKAAPMIALPTTAGTGAEVTRNAVISSPEHHVKVSMRSPKMIPTVAIVDPELTITMPPSVTASTGMDALTQVIEAYTSRKANPLTDLIALEGIRCGARSLLVAYQDGEDIKAREDMALTSLFGGLALANAGLGAVHGFAGPIGGMFNAPHGEVCASLLPHVIKANVQKIAQLDGMDALIDRYQEMAVVLTGDPQATIQDGVVWISELAKNLKIPGLREMGITKDDFPRIIEKSKAASSMKKNPIELDETILEAILNDAY
jgi:alcohol dehydrogenase class IV